MDNGPNSTCVTTFINQLASTYSALLCPGCVRPPGSHAAMTSWSSPFPPGKNKPNVEDTQITIPVIMPWYP